MYKVACYGEKQGDWDQQQMWDQGGGERSRNRKGIEEAGRGIPWREDLVKTPLNLQDITLAGNHLIQHWTHNAPEKQSGNQTGDNDDGKRLLRV